LLAVLAFFIFPKRTNRKKWFDSIYALLFGIAGVVALWVVPQRLPAGQKELSSDQKELSSRA
jgi:protein-S-isoprenylcysteine O-methyltransferase Ste14